MNQHGANGDIDKAGRRDGRRVDPPVLDDPFKGAAIDLRARTDIFPVAITVAVKPDIEVEALHRRRDQRTGDAYFQHRFAAVDEGRVGIEPAIIGLVLVGDIGRAVVKNIGHAVVIGQEIGVFFTGHPVAQPVLVGLGVVWAAGIGSRGVVPD